MVSATSLGLWESVLGSWSRVTGGWIGRQTEHPAATATRLCISGKWMDVLQGKVSRLKQTTILLPDNINMSLESLMTCFSSSLLREQW